MRGQVGQAGNRNAAKTNTDNVSIRLPPKKRTQRHGKPEGVINSDIVTIDKPGNPTGHNQYTGGNSYIITISTTTNPHARRRTIRQEDQTNDNSTL